MLRFNRRPWALAYASWRLPKGSRNENDARGQHWYGHGLGIVPSIGITAISMDSSSPYSSMTTAESPIDCN